MSRYTHIKSLSFNANPLALPLSIRLSRRAEALPTGGDADEFCTDVQTERVTTVAEVRLRGVAAAEGLTLGESGTLSFQTDPTSSGQAGRTISLAGAVLAGVELSYEQGAMATATLRFVTEAVDGSTDPFAAEDTQ